MKTLMQIAEECDTSYNTVKNFVIKEKIVYQKIHGKISLNEFQEDHIHQILYFEGKITEITIESKMNADVYS